jgi:hypothetical protein
MAHRARCIGGGCRFHEDLINGGWEDRGSPERPSSSEELDGGVDDDGSSDRRSPEMKMWT